MRKSRRKIVPAIILVLALAALGMAVLQSFLVNIEVQALQTDDQIYEITTFSTMPDSNAVSVSEKGTRVDHSSVETTVFVTLPDTLPADPAMVVFTDHRSLTCSCPHFGTFYAQSQKMDYKMGQANLLINLPENCAGQTIQLTFGETYAGKDLRLQPILVGNRMHLTKNILLDELDTSFYVLLFLICGLILLLLFALFIRKNKNMNIFFYIGCMEVLLAVWMFTDTDTSVLLMGYSPALYFISYLTFMLLPLPFLRYFCSLSIREKSRRFFNGLSVAVAASALACLSLHALHILPLIFTVLLPQLLLATVFISTMVISFVELIRDQNKHMLLPSTANLILLFGYILAMACFYQSGNYIRMFQHFVFLFSIILFAEMFYKMEALYTDAIQMKTYQRLAFTDGMTGLYNRFAFEKDIVRLCEQPETVSSLGIVALDINNLKSINDTHGHHAGDNCIQKVASIVDESFRHFGECYRIGGDEFMVLIQNRPESDLLDGILNFKTRMDRSNDSSRYTISAAFGYTYRSFAKTPLDMDAIEAMRKRADQNMYAHKRGEKAELALSGDF